MIRLTTAMRSAGLTIMVDGELSGESVAVVENFVAQAGGRGGALILYLRDVTDIDREGRALLERLAANGVRLRAEGVYWSYIVAEIGRRRHVRRVA